MRILFVHPAAAMSISDVSRGYRSAFERQGHEIRDYHLRNRFDYHTRALPEEVANDPVILSRQSSENILIEAMYHDAELVIIVSGLNVHPVALWLLAKKGIPAAVILTESPYDDESQKDWADMTRVGVEGADIHILTNDRFSAMRFGWTLLPPAFDPAIHRPVTPNPDDACDVLMVGTGWRERQAFLEAVDWSGIDLRLYGVWPDITADSPLHQFYRPLVVDNARIAEMYCSARICLTFNRRSSNALTPGPRTFELAACGAFQLSDPRRDAVTMFGGSVPTFDSPEQLGHLVRHYLAQPAERKSLAEKAMSLVQNETFDNRAAAFMVAVQPTYAVKSAAPMSVVDSQPAVQGD